MTETLGKRGMIEIRGPIRYEIDASEQEDGKWLTQYTEYFNENDWNDARSDSAELFAQMKGFMDIEVDDEKRSTHITLRGPKNQIMNMLALEFLSFSTMGEMSLKELFGLMTVKLAQAGVLEEEKE